MKKNSILFIIPNLQIRGSHIPMARIANELYLKKINLYIYNIHPLNTKNCSNTLSAFINPKIKVFDNLSEKIFSFFPDTSFVNKIYFRISNYIIKFQLYYIIKKYNIRTINSHAYLADLFVENYIDQYKNIKKVSTWHGCYESNYMASNEKNTYKEVIRKRFQVFDAIIYVSEKQYNYIKNVFNIDYLKLKKIYYGIEIEKETTTKLLNKDKITFGMLSANYEEKGWEILIVAFSKLLQKANVKLVLVGGQNLFLEYKKKYSQKNIVYIEKTNDPISWIKKFDIGILPTYYPAENLPNVIIEYLQQGKPIISTNWAEIPQMLNYNGISAGQIIPLVGGKPNVSDLKKAMGLYIQDNELFQEHKKNTSLILNKKFNIKKIAIEYYHFFKKLQTQ